MNLRPITRVTITVSLAFAILMPRISAAALLDQLQQAVAPTTFPAFGKDIAHALGLDAPLTYIAPETAPPKTALPIHSHVRRTIAAPIPPMPTPPPQRLAATASLPFGSIAETVSAAIESAQHATFNALSEIRNTLSADLAYVIGTRAPSGAAQSVPHARKRLPQSPLLPAAAALATAPFPASATSTGNQSPVSAEPQSPQSRSPPSTPSHQSTRSSFVRSAVSASAFQSAAVSQPALAFNASAFVTQTQFNSGLSALSASVHQLLSKSNTNPCSVTLKIA
jgi:hypothetical protein